MAHYRLSPSARTNVMHAQIDTNIARDLEVPMAKLRKASIAGFAVEAILSDLPEHRHAALIITYASRNADRDVLKRLFMLADMNKLVGYAGLSAVESIVARYRLTRD